MDTAIKVVSFNLKRASRFSHKNNWQRRKEIISRLIQNSGAAIIGVQELLPSMRTDMLSLLQDYSAFGFGRSKHLTNEQSAIILRNNDAAVRYDKTFWLSKHPEKQGSRAYFAQFPRICTVCEVYIKPLDRTVRVFNTHFDHICGPARTLSARIILDYMHQLNRKEKMPTILMGDMNAGPNSKPIRILSENLHHYPDIHLTNIYDCVQQEQICGTYHGFRGGQKGKPIDYMFVSDDFAVENLSIDRSSLNGRYPSDHFPLIVTLRFKAAEKGAVSA